MWQCTGFRFLDSRHRKYAPDYKRNDGGLGNHTHIWPTNPGQISINYHRQCDNNVLHQPDRWSKCEFNKDSKINMDNLPEVPAGVNGGIPM